MRGVVRVDIDRHGIGPVHGCQVTAGGGGSRAEDGVGPGSRLRMGHGFVNRARSCHERCTGGVDGGGRQRRSSTGTGGPGAQR
jgi:hypothetical protein